jgi:hypothetical protein
MLNIHSYAPEGRTAQSKETALTSKKLAALQQDLLAAPRDDRGAGLELGPENYAQGRWDF